MTAHEQAPGSVEIAQEGRGGTITYREGEYATAFGWEFALSPAIALIFAPTAAQWDAALPWAAGRQGAILAHVGAAIVEQQVPGGSYVVDGDAGVIEILEPPAAPAPPTARPPRARRPRRPRRPPAGTALDVFRASLPPTWAAWEDGAHYDLVALGAMTPEEQDEAVRIIASRDATWREVDAFSLVDTPAAHAALDAALQHHLSIETRLAAADVRAMRDPAFDLDAFLALQIRRLQRPADGLTRALRMAEAHDTPAIRQALLWASYDGTECAPAFAALLLRLCGVLPDPLDEATTRLLADLDLHNSYFARKAAFETLCARVGMVLDTDVSY